MIRIERVHKLIDLMAIRKATGEGAYETKDLTVGEAKMLRDHGHAVTHRVEKAETVWTIGIKGSIKRF